MKEIFERLPKTNLSDNGLILIDTCFFIHTFMHHNEKELAKLCEKEKVAITDFNMNEFLHVEHKVEAHVREHARKWLKKNPCFMVLQTGIHPGDREGEKAFVSMIEPRLLEEIEDPSDAVLMAAAIKTHSTVLTRDKHHLFTVSLENYLREFGLKVYNNLKME
ncbi:MAG: type II toxin-antitoxin system VapC family toxin [archaeon]